MKEELETRLLRASREQVEVAGRHAAARHEQIRAFCVLGEETPDLGVFVGDGGAAGGEGAALPAQGRDHRTVRVAKLARPGLARGGHELVARRGDGHARPGMDGDRVRPGNGRDGDLGRAEPAPVFEQAGSGLDAFAAAAHVLARARRGEGEDPSGFAAHLLDRHDRLGALRNRRSRHDANGLAAAERRRRQISRGHQARALGERPPARGFRDPDGVAVHGGRIEGRRVHVARQVLRENASGGVRERRALGRTGGAGGAHDPERLGDGGHAPILRVDCC